MLALARDGDATKDCRAFFAARGKGGPAAERACGEGVSLVRAGQLAKACSAWRRAGFFPAREEPGEDCEGALACWTGKPGCACGASPDGVSRRYCEALGGLATGLRQASACKSSPLCLAAQGREPAACEPLRGQGMRLLCARIGRFVETRRRMSGIPPEAEANRKVVAERQAKADAERQEKIEAQRKALEEAKKKKAEETERKANEAKIRILATQVSNAEKAQVKEQKPQFKKGEPMEKMPDDLKQVMERLEKGLPPYPDKKDKKKPAGGPSDGRKDR